MEEKQKYIQDVLNNMKNILNVKSDRQLSILIDTQPSSLFNSIKRGLLPYEKIIFFALKKGYSLDEIFLFKKDGSSDNFDNKIEDIQEEDYTNLAYIKVLDNEKKQIKIPLYTAYSDNIRAYLDDKKIYIINIEDKEIFNKSYYLIKSKNNYFAVSIIIELDGIYSLKDDDNNTVSKLTDKEFEELEIIGKINFRFDKKTFI